MMNLDKAEYKRSTQTGGQHRSFMKGLSLTFCTAMVICGLVVNAKAVAAQGLPLTIMKYADLQEVGAGTMRWFGFTLYTASLWSKSGKYHNVSRSTPLALHIVYDKSIQSSELISATLSEWEKLKIYDHATRLKWGQALGKIWPDVKPGDSITTYVDIQQHCYFFYNGTLLDQVEDTELSQALLSIWLHPNTSEPELRKQLIGTKRG